MSVCHTHRKATCSHPRGVSNPNHHWLSLAGSVGPAATCGVTSHSLHGQLFPWACSENHGIPSFGSPRRACTPCTRRNVNPPSVSARAVRASGERDAMTSRPLSDLDGSERRASSVLGRQGPRCVLTSDEIAGAKAARFGEVKTDTSYEFRGAKS